MRFRRAKSEPKIAWWKKILLVVLLLALPLLAASPRHMTARMVADSENGTKVMILNYHKIDDMNISLSVPPEDFDKQMKYLYDHGYHTISPTISTTVWRAMRNCQRIRYSSPSMMATVTTMRMPTPSCRSTDSRVRFS